VNLDREQRERLRAVMTRVAAVVKEYLRVGLAVMRQAWEAMAPLMAALRAAQARRPVWVPRLDGRR
jgi:hypothetical protein